jgi:hypothetical protein
MEPDRKRRAPIWKVLLLVFFVLGCLGSVAAVVMADQTTLMGVTYLQAVNSGNTWAAETLGDHFSPDSARNKVMLSLDIQRDLAYLHAAELRNVVSTRESTLSGQWVNIVRFEWREAGSTGPWNKLAMRVKLEKWLLLTYIRTVELIDP